MRGYLICNANIVNEGRIFVGDVLIEGERIVKVTSPPSPPLLEERGLGVRHIDASGKYLLPGVIDDHVHFREPGLIPKGDLYTESRAAVAGGVTSFMDMPNTDPKTTTLELLEQKVELAASKSLANFAFFLGATPGNLEEIRRADPHKVCGVKVFLGASTGNMLVDDPAILEKIFQHSPVLIAIHSEDEGIIRENLRIFKEKYGEEIPIGAHPLIRSAEACYRSSEQAVRLARKHGSRLHILHLSTARELELLDRGMPLAERHITGEVCIHHLWFNDADYAELGALIKWNPAIKSRSDQEALFQAVLDDTIAIIATDHAPHLREEKARPYLSCPSGGPLIQHSLVAMLEFHHRGKISLEKLVQKMAHDVATLYRIEKRGFIREGYFADLALVDLDAPWTVTKDNLLYKCRWSPFEGKRFTSSVSTTWVNGHLVYKDGQFDETKKGKRILFNHA
ncbi:MAG: dihydroorotase [bacterium]